MVFNKTLAKGRDLFMLKLFLAVFWPVLLAQEEDTRPVKIFYFGPETEEKLLDISPECQLLDYVTGIDGAHNVLPFLGRPYRPFLGDKEGMKVDHGTVTMLMSKKAVDLGGNVLIVISPENGHGLEDYYAQSIGIAYFCP